MDNFVCRFTGDFTAYVGVAWQDPRHCQMVFPVTEVADSIACVMLQVLPLQSSVVFLSSLISAASPLWRQWRWRGLTSSMISSLLVGVDLGKFENVFIAILFTRRSLASWAGALWPQIIEP